MPRERPSLEGHRPWAERGLSGFGMCSMCVEPSECYTTGPLHASWTGWPSNLPQAMRLALRAGQCPPASTRKVHSSVATQGSEGRCESNRRWPVIYNQRVRSPSRSPLRRRLQRCLVLPQGSRREWQGRCRYVDLRLSLLDLGCQGSGGISPPDEGVQERVVEAFQLSCGSQWEFRLLQSFRLVDDSPSRSSPR